MKFCPNNIFPYFSESIIFVRYSLIAVLSQFYSKTMSDYFFLLYSIGKLRPKRNYLRLGKLVSLGSAVCDGNRWQLVIMCYYVQLCVYM